METLYRKVAVSERLPQSSGYYWIEDVVGEMKSAWFIPREMKFGISSFNKKEIAKYWLEPIKSDNSHQIEKLEADKAELLEALEIFFPMFTELDSEFGIENPHPRKWTETEIATVQKLFDLIQKMKQ